MVAGDGQRDTGMGRSRSPNQVNRANLDLVQTVSSVSEIWRDQGRAARLTGPMARICDTGASAPRYLEKVRGICLHLVVRARTVGP
jgi:hypothetical protein